MELLFIGFSDPDKLLSDNHDRLRRAISEKSYPRIYKELRGYDRTFPPNGAFCLLHDALEADLTCKAFKAILKRCPPVPEILSADTTGVMEKVIGLDRADVLSLLLEGGASPNLAFNYMRRPLETALKTDSLHCVRLLMEQPELDTAWTDFLLRWWAEPDELHPAHETCLRAMAPRFTGWEARAGQPLPIPEPMTLWLIVDDQNWPLMERFCRERAPISQEDGSSSLWKVSFYARKDISVCAGGLTALLENCPDLFRNERACRALLRCFLHSGEDDPAGLRPWVEGLRRSRMTMGGEDWIDWNYGGLPECWQKLLPQGPALVIDRWSDVLDGFYLFALCHRDLHPPKILGRILAACPILGEGRKGELSPVARVVLYCGDPPLIEGLFRQPQGLLAAEDPDAMVQYVLEHDCPRENRAAVLAHVRKKADYDL